jgi:hypothetical protein
VELDTAKKLVVDKLDVINISETLYSDKAERLNVPLNGKNITIQQMFDKTLGRIGKEDFFLYSALTKRNCQDFVSQLLKSEDLYKEKEAEFVYQPLDELLKELPSYMGTFAKSVTDLSATAKKLLGFGNKQAGFIRAVMAKDNPEAKEEYEAKHPGRNSSKFANMDNFNIGEMTKATKDLMKKKRKLIPKDEDLYNYLIEKAPAWKPSKEGGINYSGLYCVVMDWFNKHKERSDKSEEAFPEGAFDEEEEKYNAKVKSENISKRLRAISKIIKKHPLKKRPIVPLSKLRKIKEDSDLSESDTEYELSDSDIELESDLDEPSKPAVKPSKPSKPAYKIVPIPVPKGVPRIIMPVKKPLEKRTVVDLSKLRKVKEEQKQEENEPVKPVKSAKPAKHFGMMNKNELKEFLKGKTVKQIVELGGRDTAIRPIATELGVPHRRKGLINAEGVATNIYEYINK